MAWVAKEIRPNVWRKYRKFSTDEIKTALILIVIAAGLALVIARACLGR